MLRFPRDGRGAKLGAEGADKWTARACVNCRNKHVSHTRKGVAKGSRVREGEVKAGQ